MAYGKGVQMTIRLIGAVMIIVGCASFGFLLATAHILETSTLKQLIQALQLMESELKYRKTPLPLLCHYVALGQSGLIKTYFLSLESELQQQIQPDAATCAQLALDKMQYMPKQTKHLISQLGKSLGKFDVDGQVLGIQTVREEAVLRVKHRNKDQDQRIKNYRIFGICAGIAIVILFI